MKKKKGLLTVGIVLLLFSVILSFSFVGIYIFAKENCNYEIDERLFASSGNSSVATYYAFTSDGIAEVVWQSKNAKKTLNVKFEEVPKNLKNAFLSAEDRRFYSHRGVDFKRTAMALINYIIPGGNTFGASTITQQVIKNISGDDDYTVKRKILEIMRARHLEARHTKDEIFEMYLNIVPMSDNIYGVKMAANTYFGKELYELTLAECATIVGITNAPTKFNPYKHPEACREKRNRVLYAMLDNGVIDQEEYEKAKEEPLTVAAKTEEERSYSSWFIETVNEDVTRDLVEKYSISESAARIMINSGMKIYTTMDRKVQSTLEEYFENSENLPKEVKEGLNFAFTVVNPRDNTLLGIIGAAGEKSGDRLLNQATVPHTPGSVLKPIALYLPLLDEKKINYASVFDDTPTEITENDGNYTLYPHNSPDVYDGLITVKDALRLSKNTVAVKLYQMLGKERIYKSLYEDYGFRTLVKEEKSADGRVLTDLGSSPLSLGQLTRGVSLRKMTEAYTVFYDGTLKKGRSYYRAEDTDGNTVLDNTESQKRIASEESARIMTALLSEVADNGTAKSINLKRVVDVAGKTGTSGADKDKWFIGYTPYFTAGIWCGYADGRGVYSLSKSHLAVWDGVMSKLHGNLGETDYKNFSKEGLIRLPYCKISGCKFTEICSMDERGNMLEFGFFTEDNAPTRDCTLHKAVFDENGNLRIKIDYKRDLPSEIPVSDGYMLISENDRITDLRSQKEESKRKRKRFFFF